MTWTFDSACITRSADTSAFEGSSNFLALRKDTEIGLGCSHLPALSDATRDWPNFHFLAEGLPWSQLALVDTELLVKFGDEGILEFTIMFSFVSLAPSPGGSKSIEFDRDVLCGVVVKSGILREESRYGKLLIAFR